MFVLIFVCVGSRSYQFDRLFAKLDKLWEEGIIKEDIFAQIGVSSYKPKHFQYKDFIAEEEFIDKINEAHIVISHGASGSIMKALNAKKKVVAVTRLEKYGEHINDHQIQINEAFAVNKYVLSVYNMEELGEALKAYYEDTAEIVPWENTDPMAIVNLIDNFIIENWYSVKSL
ncbi:PssE/Cps14G family polysaccharide biosynthesis glycosyltransferase [Lachnoclostridium phytofermentans]|uniref:PssE/Cps14G family polysaccharide biosynthesis glycosyltransferase n=1 Tax=Lachnoclostridium phytofermentans TaxID=66219 RepID=UPI0038CC0459